MPIDIAELDVDFDNDTGAPILPPDFSPTIEQTAERLAALKITDATLWLYADGSWHDRRWGGAGVAWWDKKSMEWGNLEKVEGIEELELKEGWCGEVLALGAQSSSNDCELAALWHALGIARRAPSKYSDIRIVTDNIGCIQICKPDVRSFALAAVDVTMWWTRSHSGVENGNWMADKMANYGAVRSELTGQEGRWRYPTAELEPSELEAELSRYRQRPRPAWPVQSPATVQRSADFSETAARDFLNRNKRKLGLK